MGFFPGALDKMFGMKAFAGQPSLHVDDAGKNRIDLAGCGCGLQCVEGKLACHVLYPLVKMQRNATAGRALQGAVPVAMPIRMPTPMPMTPPA